MRPSSPFATPIAIDRSRNATDDDVAGVFEDSYRPALGRLPSGQQVFHGLPFDLGAVRYHRRIDSIFRQIIIFDHLGVSYDFGRKPNRRTLSNSIIKPSKPIPFFSLSFKSVNVYRDWCSRPGKNRYKRRISRVANQDRVEAFRSCVEGREKSVDDRIEVFVS